VSLIPSPDARAVVRALDALTTQVRRLADTRRTPADDATTTADDGPRCVQCGSPNVRYRNYREQPFCWPCANGEQQAPAADEDQALRWARREPLLVLLTRLQRGRTLTEEEATLLRQHVETEMRDADTAREKAGDLAETYKHERRRGDALAEERNAAWAELKREQQASAGLAGKIREQREVLARVRAELEQAQTRAEELEDELRRWHAAVERVRDAARWARQNYPGMVQVHARLTDALDGTEQPTTEQP
jgi:chromosome segregation ATPase